MDKSVLECDSIRVSFGYKTLLSDVFFRCETGNVIGLLGRNGSGKSTLLKVVRGLIPADNKFVRVDGVCAPDSVNKCISYLGQVSAIPREFSVRKAISLSLSSSESASLQKDEIIGPIWNQKISALSTGECRYLEIRIILAKKTNFVLLDEPFSGISPHLAERIAQLIRIAALSKGIILTDHNYQHVLDVSTHVTVLKGGRLHHLEDTNELLALEYLP